MGQQMGGGEAVVVEKNSVDWQSDGCRRQHPSMKGLSLIELVVVLSIISVLAAISLPALTKAKHQAGRLKCMRNQREAVSAVTFYSMDNDGWYPPSVATIGTASRWHWEAPTMLTGYNIRAPGLHRAMSEYLGCYINDARTMFCPNAPRKYKYLQDAWDAGDDWNHPETGPIPDPVYGSYCFYWNYMGWLGQARGVFKGPAGTSYDRRRSKLLVTDYFGYDHWRSRGAFGSSERFKRGNITEGTYVSSAYWSCAGSSAGPNPAELKVRLHAGYTDGHVDSFTPGNVAAMWVSVSADGTVSNTIGPGIFYLPRRALR